MQREYGNKVDWSHSVIQLSDINIKTITCGWICRNIWQNPASHHRPSLLSDTHSKIFNNAIRSTK